MKLPAKLDRPRSGIERVPRRDWPAHRAFIRRHACIVTLSAIIDECDGPIECAHVRLGARNNGGGIKPHDGSAVSLCRKHHAESHRIGEASFARKYRINMLLYAKQFALLSTVPEVREYAKTMNENDADFLARAEQT